MGFAANWGKIWPFFEKERQILVFDQRGHGKSAKPVTGYAPSDYAQDLKNLLETLGWKKIHLVGHSMGGRVAMQFAHLFPKTVSCLILEDSGAEANPSRIQWIQNLLGSVPTPFFDREEAKKFFSSHFSNDPTTGGFLYANLENKSDGTLHWRFHAPGMIETIEKGRAVDGTGIFKSLTIPILLIRGEKSIELPASEATRMTEINPHSKLITIPDASHYVHADKPKEFIETLTAFLQACESGQP